ncbi:MAG: hypothetical protein GY851_34585, partial [bacterium]|nr:hypothetical protein [bacterium]
KTIDNDLMHTDRKVCGLLVESKGSRTALGIGINVKHRAEDFPPEVQTVASSVEAASGKPCDRGQLLASVLTALDERVMVLEAGGFQDVYGEWAEACAIHGHRVRSGEIEGVVKDIDTTGALVLETELGPRRIVFGEVVEVNGA